MKPFDETPKAEGQEIHAEIDKHFRFIGREKAKRGHILFEYDATEDKILPAKIEEQPSIVGIDNKIQKGAKKVNMKKNCTYFWALNPKNAEIKIIKAKQEYEQAKSQGDQSDHQTEESNSGIQAADSNPI